jgi:hypothetical protein
VVVGGAQRAFSRGTLVKNKSDRPYLGLETK